MNENVTSKQMAYAQRRAFREAPPWVLDGNPEYWVQASLAARFYFSKSVSTVRRMIENGELKRQGILTYWDGTRWFVRLPTLITRGAVEIRPRRRDEIIDPDVLAKYQLSLDEYVALLKAQDKRCGICGKQVKLHIDHDHKTNKVRGLLCNGCNTGLGKLGDSIEGIKAAFNYLSLTPMQSLTTQTRQTHQTVQPALSK